MVNFVYYDLGFLVLFSICIALFLYKNRKKLQIESKIIFLYRTKMGIDTISYVAKKHPKLLKFLSNFVIVAGYLIMVVAVGLLFWVLSLMFKSVVLPKIPPLIPLVPYIDKALPTGLVPPFYFTYWIIVIAIVAVFHEFAHGIFAKLRGIRLKSTGFGFIGPLLAAFVELDEKQMAKKPIKDQLAVLAAGSSANFILWIVFLIITASFFSLAFVPAGINFSTYMVDQVNFSDITLINDNGLSRSIESFDEFSAVIESINESEIEVKTGENSFFTDYETVMLQKKIAESSEIMDGFIIMYSDTPAYRTGLSGAIQEIKFGEESYQITSMETLQETLEILNPGDEVEVITTSGEYELTLAANPEDKNKSFLGIGFSKTSEGLISKLATALSYRDPFVHYIPKGGSTNGSIIEFIFHLLYWITIVNFFVMLFNMLPVGIVDGGRYFYLTALALTKSEKKAFRWFKSITWMIILIFLLMMVVWFLKAF